MIFASIFPVKTNNALKSVIPSKSGTSEPIPAAEAAAQTYTCTHCGATVSATDLFCSGCGTAIDVIKQEIAEQNAAAADSAVNSNRVCASCGAAMGEDDMFCMSCGTKYDSAAESQAQADEEPATDDACASKEADAE